LALHNQLPTRPPPTPAPDPPRLWTDVERRNVLERRHDPPHLAGVRRLHAPKRYEMTALVRADVGNEPSLAAHQNPLPDARSSVFSARWLRCVRSKNLHRP